MAIQLDERGHSVLLLSNTGIFPLQQTRGESSL